MTDTMSPRIFQAIALARALETYARTGIKVNRAYTPTNMIRTAKRITGKDFKARDYAGAAKALRLWADRTHYDEVHTATEEENPHV